MEYEKPNCKLWANYERISLRHAALILNNIEPKKEFLDQLEQARNQIKSDHDISALKELEKPPGYSGFSVGWCGMWVCERLLWKFPAWLAGSTVQRATGISGIHGNSWA